MGSRDTDNLGGTPDIRDHGRQVGSRGADEIDHRHRFLLRTRRERQQHRAAEQSKEVAPCSFEMTPATMSAVHGSDQNTRIG
jgi:hypothetical protein